MCVCGGGGEDCIGFLKALVGINLLQKHRFEIIIVSPAFGRWFQGTGRKAHSKETTGGDMRSAVKFWVAAAAKHHRRVCVCFIVFLVHVSFLQLKDLIKR